MAKSNTQKEYTKWNYTEIKMLTFMSEIFILVIYYKIYYYT